MTAASQASAYASITIQFDVSYEDDVAQRKAHPLVEVAGENLPGYLTDVLVLTDSSNPRNRSRMSVEMPGPDYVVTAVVQDAAHDNHPRTLPARARAFANEVARALGLD